MNKKQLKDFWKWFRNVHPWYFFAIATVFLAIGVLALRSNYVRMTELREAVYAADRDGGDIESALQDLRSHVTSHMNTSLTSGNDSIYPPIQLKHTYERLVQQAGQQNSQTNEDLYNAAQRYCEQTIPSGFSGRVRVQCIQDYVARHMPTKAPTNIPVGLYKFDFVSPAWTPDIAGISLLFAVLSLGWGLVVLVLNRLARRALTI